MMWWILAQIPQSPQVPAERVGDWDPVGAFLVIGVLVAVAVAVLLHRSPRFPAHEEAGDQHAERHESLRKAA